MDSKVKRVIDQFRRNVEVFKTVGREDVHDKVIKIMERPGFIRACEYFVEHGFDSSEAIDQHIGSVRSDFLVDQVDAGVSAELWRESLAYAYNRLEGFPDDAKEAMVDMGSVMVELVF